MIDVHRDGKSSTLKESQPLTFVAVLKAIREAGRGQVGHIIRSNEDDLCSNSIVEDPRGRRSQLEAVTNHCQGGPNTQRTNHTCEGFQSSTNGA